MDVLTILFVCIFLVITLGSFISTILHNHIARLYLLTGATIWMLTQIYLRDHLPNLLLKKPIIYSGTIPSMLSIICASILLGWVNYRITFMRGFIYTLALYATQVYIDYVWTLNKPIFDYPNGPSLLSEFWSYSEWIYFEDNRPILIIFTGILVLILTKQVAKYIKRKDSCSSGVDIV